MQSEENIVVKNWTHLSPDSGEPCESRDYPGAEIDVDNADLLVPVADGKAREFLLVKTRQVWVKDTEFGEASEKIVETVTTRPCTQEENDLFNAAIETTRIEIDTIHKVFRS